MSETNTNENMEKYIEGHVNDPSRNEEENNLATEKVREYWKLEKAKENVQEMKHESALDFKNRMLADLQASIFDIIKTITDSSLRQSFVRQYAKYVKEKYWSVRPDLARKVIHDLANSKDHPEIRKISAEALELIESEKV